MQNALKLISFIWILTFTGCSNIKDDSALIIELSIKFPQFGEIHPVNTYLNRSIVAEPQHLQIELYKVLASSNDYQQIFLIKDLKGRSYAFPFFSNTFSGYWNFQFEKTVATGTGNNFEIEFNSCLKALKLDNAKALRLIDEMMLSALHCKEIEVSDSSQLNNTRISYNDSLPEESDSCCTNRIRNNWRFILKDQFSDTAFPQKIAYWDKENGRIYQFDLTDIKKTVPFYFKVKVFRNDCVFHMLEL